MLTINSLNPNLLRAEYAVRGPIVQRAQQLEEKGQKIIYCNIGNPQSLKQKPLSYIRQVLSLLEYPELMQHPEAVKLFPKDLVARAQDILAKNPSGLGAYTQSPGLPFIREAVAQFIRKRDGIPASKETIVLTDGASKGAQAVILALLKSHNDGFMIPIPQYPLYSATINLQGGKQIGYYLDEKNHWQLNKEILTQSIAQAKQEGVNPVGIVVINPGNPTGAVLSRENVEMVIQFAHEHGLSIIADEVYQENVYEAGLSFYSFEKVMHEMKITDIALFCLHSVSKGFLGECGHRGGYIEFRNLPGDVMAEFIKLQSISLCSNVVGQIVTYLMVAPPQPGDESYATYVAERDAILRDLKTKAEILGRGINQIKGMSMDIPQGAMYAFVRFQLPVEKNVNTSTMTASQRRDYEAKRDNDFCLKLVEKTGICVVPGSGFGQEPGTFHFRTTFLPPKDQIEDLVKSMKTFYESYVKEVA
ncbi:MAG: aminotransferase class I/II-fold pyridoxal phosphate-dependent enzyme [Chitinivibrionales bacterium]|nr:aminotransferase class I/II-fold pyridoxal phosphate-dependent enzyme [Chitinivibrionales bacterium]